MTIPQVASWQRRNNNRLNNAFFSDSFFFHFDRYRDNPTKNHRSFNLTLELTARTSVRIAFLKELAQCRSHCPSINLGLCLFVGVPGVVFTPTVHQSFAIRAVFCKASYAAPRLVPNVTLFGSHCCDLGALGYDYIKGCIYLWEFHHQVGILTALSSRRIFNHLDLVSLDVYA